MKQISMCFAAGLMIGGLLFGGTAAYAAGVISERSTNRIFVDGREVRMEAYNINGSNYVRLRDIGKKVGFDVSWDGAVKIDTTTPYEEEATARTVNLPTDGTKYVPKAGDMLPCDDGTLYEIKDTSRFENNVFAPGALPELPVPTCDWSRFPERELPKVELRHFSDAAGDDLFVRNLHETRRMQYTIYNALGNEPTAWRDGKPLATVELDTPAEYEAYTAKFWPWRESELLNLVRSRPNSRFYVSAWDFYHDGSFMYTRYCVLSL